MSMLDELKQVTEGNAGALSLCIRVLHKYESWVLPCFLYDLNKKKIFGHKIWELYKGDKMDHELTELDFDIFVKKIWSGAPIDNFRRDTKIG